MGQILRKVKFCGSSVIRVKSGGSKYWSIDDQGQLLIYL